MNVEKHLTDDALIALASNQIPESLRKEAVDHLAECEICRTKHRQIRSIYSVVRYANANGMLPPEETSHPQLDLGRLQRIFPWRAIGGIAVGIVAVLAIILGLHTEPKVDAAVLVGRALANEHSAGAASAFTIQMRGTRCGAGDRGVMKVAVSPLCQKATSQIVGTSWASGNPLSATKFKEWRSSLHNFRDKVEKRPDGWVIETSTSQGPVRQAKFSLRSDTYHPFELDLELSDNEELSFIETVPTPIPAEQTGLLSLSAVSKSPKPVEDDATDALEVQAWELLHQINADSGWEATVVRGAGSVAVQALVANNTRKEEFDAAFRAYPKVALSLHEYDNPGASGSFLPHRDFDEGGAPPLAHAWLASHFPNEDERREFTNRTANLSRQLLGHAYMLDELKKRQSGLAACSCAKDLDPLIAAQQSKINELRDSLRSVFDPIVGPLPSQPEKPLTYASARRLDSAVLQIVSTTSIGSSLTLDEEKLVLASWL